MLNDKQIHFSCEGGFEHMNLGPLGVHVQDGRVIELFMKTSTVFWRRNCENESENKSMFEQAQRIYDSRSRLPERWKDIDLKHLTAEGAYSMSRAIQACPVNVMNFVENNYIR
jgi:hypothetical protein